MVSGAVDDVPPPRQAVARPRTATQQPLPRPAPSPSHHRGRRRARGWDGDRHHLLVRNGLTATGAESSTGPVKSSASSETLVSRCSNNGVSGTEASLCLVLGLSLTSTEV